MDNLNYGIEINRGGSVGYLGQPPYGITYPAGMSMLRLLTRNSDWAIWGDKATGTSKGLNSPATNPIQDLVGVVGKNLFDGFLELGSINTSNGLNSASSTVVRTPLFLKVSPLTTYTVSLANRWYQYDSNFNFIITNTNATFTTEPNCQYLRLIRVSTDLNSQIQLEPGTVATAYEPYGKANGLLQGFAFTPTDGYKDFTMLNGKISTGLQFDGLNSYVRLP